MRIQIQLRIIADDNSVISEGEILHFDKGDDRLEVIGLSCGRHLPRRNTRYQAIRYGPTRAGLPPAGTRQLRLANRK
jgi:hypothetical protein